MLRNWQRLLQNWAFYNQFSEGSFLCPIPIENCTPLKKILRCLNIGFILTFLKKLMLRNWQRLLQNWAFYNQFSKGSFCPQSRAKNVLTWKFFELPQYRNPKILHGKKIGKDCFRTERFRTNLAREVFCPQSRTKNVRTWKNFELPQYRNPKILHGK